MARPSNDERVYKVRWQEPKKSGGHESKVWYTSDEALYRGKLMWLVSRGINPTFAGHFDCEWVDYSNGVKSQ